MILDNETIRHNIKRIKISFILILFAQYVIFNIQAINKIEEEIVKLSGDNEIISNKVAGNKRIVAKIFLPKGIIKRAQIHNITEIKQLTYLPLYKMIDKLLVNFFAILIQISS